MRSVSSCTHHWVIEPPSGGRFSPGKCKRCGQESQFPNWNEKDFFRDFNTGESFLDSRTRGME